MRRSVGEVIAASWRSRDGRWLLDRVTGKGPVAYRILDEGEPVGEFGDDIVAVAWWAGEHGLVLAELAPVDAGDDPFCE